MGEMLAVVITMGARELVCGEREREERRRGEKQVSGTETFVKMWYINVRCDRHFVKHRSYEPVVSVKTLGRERSTLQYLYLVHHSTIHSLI